MMEDAFRYMKEGKHAVGLKLLLQHSEKFETALIQVLRETVVDEIQEAQDDSSIKKATSLLTDLEGVEWDKVISSYSKLCPLLTACLQAAFSSTTNQTQDWESTPPLKEVTGVLLSLIFCLLRLDHVQASRHLQILLSWLPCASTQVVDEHTEVEIQNLKTEHFDINKMLDTYSEPSLLKSLQAACSISLDTHLTDSHTGEPTKEPHIEKKSLNDLQGVSSDTECYSDLDTETTRYNPSQSPSVGNAGKNELFPDPQETSKVVDRTKSKQKISKRKVTKNKELSKLDRLPSKRKRKSTGKPQKCSECGAVYSSQYRLKIHMVSHTGNYPYRCKECGQGFHNPHSLKEHSYKHTGKTPFVCHICNKSMARKQGLTVHMLKHSGSRPFKCADCGKGFLYEAALRSHRTIHTGERPFACDQCDKTFRINDQLQKHKYSHSGTVPYSCEMCDKGYTDPGALRYHIRSAHMNERRYPCAQCEQRFYHASHLKSHQRTHNTKRTHPCPHCGKTFKAELYYQRHLETHTGQNTCLCPICGRKFSSQYYLREHIEKHKDKTQYSCEQCGQGFGIYIEYRQHVKEHLGENPFQCKDCGKIFTKPFFLRIHQNMHTGQRPFMCAICAKGFTSKGLLTRHELTHSSDKPFKCSQCEKGFRRASQLKQHENVHVPPEQRIKPYQCGECDKQFEQANSLKRHTLTHSKASNFCSVCNKAFSRIDNLKNHMKTCHM